MVGSPDEGLSNTMPPKATLAALALMQFGILLAVERPMRRALRKLRLWAAVVLINTMIMTVYLWHITVMIICIAVLYLAGGFGLGFEPGGEEWWLSRPIWISFLLVVLAPVALALSGFERRARRPDAPIPAPAVQVIGAMLLCLGIAFLARYGYGGGPMPHFDLIAFGLVVVGSAVNGLLPSFGKRGAA